MEQINFTSQPEQATENPEKDKQEDSKLVEVEKNVYRLDGEMTEETIEEINNFKNKTTIILENTKGLSSEMLSQIDSDRVFFSVKGGLDYEKIEKYQADKYRERTEMSPKGLEKVIKYFEKVEHGMQEEWTDAQKCMYAYGCLAEDINYGEEQDKLLSNDTAARSLNGVLYGELVCAGFAFTFQEMMNRAGIESHYQNQKDTHAYNVVRLDGKYYGIDVTWDSVQKENGECNFRNFGQDEHFYERYGHQNYREVESDNMDEWEQDIKKRVYDDEEERFELSTFSVDELRDNYQIISPQMQAREKGAYRNFSEQPDEVKEKYLPIDTIAKALAREADHEYDDYADIYNFLRKEKALDIDPSLGNAMQTRVNYVLDVREQNYLHDEPVFGKEEKDQYQHLKTQEMHGERVDHQAKEALANSLNTQLITAIDSYIEKTYDNIEQDIGAYEYDKTDMDDNRKVEEANRRTKMSLILSAKERLIALGHSKDEVDDICQQIQQKFDEADSSNETDGPSQKEHGLDFLGSAFSDKQAIRQDIEEIEGYPISDTEFEEKIHNPDYLLGTVYTNLDLDEYGLKKKDFEELINQLY